MTNKEKKEAINKWQKCKFVHQLICGKEKCNGVLEPKESGNPLNKIYLGCPKCDYIQYNIPEMVFNLNYEQFEKLEKFLNE